MIEQYNYEYFKGISIILNFIVLGPYWTQANEEVFKLLVKYGQWIPLETRILGRKEIRGKQFEVVEILDLNNMVRYLLLLSSIHLMHLV